jgi:hypothetical protein
MSNNFFVSIENKRQKKIRQRRQAPRVLSSPEYEGASYYNRIRNNFLRVHCGS